MSPTMRPTNSPITSGAVAGSRPGATLLAMVAYSWLNSHRSNTNESTTATSTPSAKARASRSPAMPTANSTHATATPMKSRVPWRMPQPMEPEQPLAQEERRPDDDEVDREQDEDDARPMRPATRATWNADLGRLRPWQARHARAPSDTRRRGRPRSGRSEAGRPVSVGRSRGGVRVSSSAGLREPAAGGPWIGSPSGPG